MENKKESRFVKVIKNVRDVKKQIANQIVFVRDNDRQLFNESFQELEKSILESMQRNTVKHHEELKMHLSE